MATSKILRSKTKFWLIGQPLSQLHGSKLPSNGEVLRHFLYYHRLCKKTEREAAISVLEGILDFWNRARIPTMTPNSGIRKLLTLHKKWTDLRKGKNRKGSAQEAKKREFLTVIDNLFDIASCDALERISIEEDKAFLIAQRKPGRHGSMVGVDRGLTKKEE